MPGALPMGRPHEQVSADRTAYNIYIYIYIRLKVKDRPRLKSSKSR